MATYTSNYNLSKPENTDTHESFISAYRDNMDIIDKQMGNKNIAEEYDNTQTYAVDDYVIYDGDLYKCTTAVTSAEDFDSNKWTQTVASDEFGSGGGGSGSLDAIETTSSAYSQLPSADKQDATKIYFLNDTQSGTQNTPIDATTFTNRAEYSGCMGLSVTNGKLTYVYKGGSAIGANSYRNIAIPSTVSKIKFKLTTGTSYSTGTNPNWVVCIGVKANQYTDWINPTDSNWLVKKEFDTRNSSYEDYLDLSNISTDCYLMIVAHGWTVTFDEITLEEPSAPTGETKIKYKDITYGADGSGNSWKDLIQTLSAGSTSITFNDAEISNTSTFEFFTDVFGVCPTNAVVSNGSVTLTFDARQSDLGVMVRVTNGTESPYIFKNYLEVSSAGPYIDTGVANSSDAYFEIDFQYTGTPTNSDGIFGATGYSGNEFVVSSYGGVSYALAGGSTKVNFTSTNQQRHKIKADSNGIDLDGVVSTSGMNWSNASNFNYYIFAFNYRGGSTIYGTGHAKIYSVKIWNGSALVRDMIPAIRKSDNEIGMYDRVNDVFYTNDGTGSFTTN